MKTHILHGYRDHADLARLANEWVREANNRGLRVVDIDYGYTTDGSWGWYSAMIKYDVESGVREADMQVHIFHGHREHSELQAKVNSWLDEAEGKGLEIIDVKYGYTTDRTWGWYSAMVIYKSRY